MGHINRSRLRHAEEITSRVDVEIILADTIRISSDDKVINSARAAIAHHCASNVKIITTKIDVSRRASPFFGAEMTEHVLALTASAGSMHRRRL